MISPAEVLPTDSRLAFLASDELTVFRENRLTGIPGQHKSWPLQNSSLQQYLLDATCGAPTDDLLEAITAQVGIDQANVGIDIAGGVEGQALQDLMQMKVLGRALLTNFTDARSEETRQIPDLDHIDGDLIDPQTWAKILSWQQAHAPDGFALALHRPAGAIQALPANFYQSAAHLVLDMLKPGGLMFSQIPDKLLNGRHPEVHKSIAEREDVAAVGYDNVQSPRFVLIGKAST